MFRREGFTLIELLIVIVVMAILATMLTPTISAVIQAADVRKSQAFVQRVARAADAFKGANNGSYPGQDDIGQLRGTTPDPGPYTGSQIIAARLFDYPDTDINKVAPKATSRYLEYKAYLLITKSSKGSTIPKNSLADDSRTGNALLYFPSRRNVTAPTACYKWDDNSTYIKKDATSAKAAFENKCAKDPRTGTVARNAGGILIIGTGSNDKYLETSDNDDVKSWEIHKKN
jgi:prepilin-type N-terminal cleavage/methylation domain-containing protein